MIRPEVSLLVFDWDGTLMDSESRIVNCFQKAAQDLGERVPEKAEVRAIIGLNLAQAWQNLMPELSLDRQQALDRRYREHFIDLDTTPMPYYPGVLAGLVQLAGQGYWLAVATGKSRRGLDRALAETQDGQRIAEWFVATRCGDETFSKPHPQMLRDILDFTGKEAHEAVMIGDTTFDMHMAQAAGVASLAVRYGVHPAAQLAPLATLGVADDFAGVVRVFAREHGE